MRLVQWEDENGLLRSSFVKDNDPDEAAAQGIPHDPPDISRLDWDQIQTDLHNELVKRGLFSWADVQKQQTTLPLAINAVLKQRLMALYREKV